MSRMPLCQAVLTHAVPFPAWRTERQAHSNRQDGPPLTVLWLSISIVLVIAARIKDETAGASISGPWKTPCRWMLPFWHVRPMKEDECFPIVVSKQLIRRMLPRPLVGLLVGRGKSTTKAVHRVRVVDSRSCMLTDRPHPRLSAIHLGSSFYVCPFLWVFALDVRKAVQNIPIDAHSGLGIHHILPPTPFLGVREPSSALSWVVSL